MSIPPRPAGIFVYTMLSALAEFERRTLSSAPRKGCRPPGGAGKRIGRPPTLTERQVSDARRRIECTGSTATSVAREMGIPRWTLSRAIKRQTAAGQAGDAPH